MSYGLVDIERFQVLQKDTPGLRLFVDGEDATERCRWANDETGEAWLYVLDSNGNRFVNPFTGQVAGSVVNGNVQFIDINAPKGHDYDKDLSDFRRWMGW